MKRGYCHILVVFPLVARPKNTHFKIFDYLYILQSLNSIKSMTLKEKVEQALDTLRPYLETDGGNVSVEEITADNVVRLKLLGACASCSMSIMTFKAGLEQAIKKAVPEITAVEAINLTDPDSPEATLPPVN